MNTQRTRKRRRFHVAVAAAWAAALLLAAVPAPALNLYWDADGDGSTATGGSGTWDASTALWRPGSGTGTPLQAWPNANPNVDTAFLAGTVGILTIASGTTIYVNGISCASNADAYTLTGGDASSILAFTGTNPTIACNVNGALTVTNLTIDVGTGLTISQNGASRSFNFNSGARFTGAGVVTFSSSGWGQAANLNAAQPLFAGGFDIGRPSTSYRSTVVSATVADALGLGAVTVGTGGGASILNYAWGAQTPGGAPVDGGPAGVTTSGYGTLALAGAWTASKDRFTIAGGTVLRGSSAQLSALTRVNTFTNYAGATGPEVVLQPGAVVCNTDGTGASATVAGLGTNRDLLYGIYGTMNSAGFALTIGGGTPWAGLGKDSNGDYTDVTLRQGTITINDAAGALGEIVLRSNGVNYNYTGASGATATASQMNNLTLGNGSDCPTFQLAAGSNKVDARILGTGGLGNVNLNSSAVGSKFSGAIARFVVGGPERGTLQLQQANATGGVPIDVENLGNLWLTNAAGMDSVTTIKAGGRLYVDGVFGGTGALSVEAGGFVSLTNVNGLTGTQNGASVASAVQAGAIVQFNLNDPAGLGSTQAGAILEVQAINGGSQSLGNFAANGQILAHTPEGYNAQSGFISDSGAGGISGTLTITAASSGTYPHSQTSPFEIRENFLAGADLTAGPTTAGFTVRGFAQNAPVYLNNSANAMSAVHIGGPGLNGAPVLRVANPGSLNGNAGTPATIGFLFANGGDLEVAGGASDVYHNPINVASGMRGGLSAYSYQTAGTITWNGTVTLADSATFATLDNTGRFTADGNEFRNVRYSNIVVADGATATVAQNMVGFDNGSVFRNVTYVDNLTVPVASTLRKTGVGRLYLNATPADFHGTLDVTAGVVKFVGSATVPDGVLMFSGGTLTLNTDCVTGTAILGYNTGGAVNAFTTLQDYTGGTLFKSGVVTFTNDNQLGGATAPLIFEGGTLRVNTAGAYAASRAVTLNAPGGTVDTNGKATTFSNTVSGTGSLTKAGTGDLNLGVANSFSGDTKVSGGTLTLGHAQALQNSTLDYNGYGGTLAFGSLAAATVGGLKGSQNLALPAGFTLTVGNNDQSTTYAGDLSGTGAGLTKIGSGTLTLSGASRHTGMTTVSDGTLLLTGSLSGSVTINGGTFAGTGTVGGNVNLTGGTLAPGLSPGVLAIGGDLDLGPEGLLLIDVGGALPGDGAGFYAQLLVGGDATLDGLLDFAFVDGFLPDPADVFFILARDGGSGTFAGLPEGATLTLGPLMGRITYLADWTGTQAGSTLTGGNDVALYGFAIPEPGTALLLAGLAAAALGTRRRRC
jgi:autotransporter-associated beta strand protein